MTAAKTSEVDGARRDRRCRSGEDEGLGILNQKSSRLSQEARQHLFRRVETMQHSTALPRVGARVRRTGSSFDSTLPGYDELRLFRSIGQKFGVDNPYFRLHEARAGSQHADRRESDPQFLLLRLSRPERSSRTSCRPPRPRSTATASRPRPAVTSPANVRCIAALEHALADHYGVRGLRSFCVSGYATNVGVIGHLVGPKDLLVHDALVPQQHRDGRHAVRRGAALLRPQRSRQPRPDAGGRPATSSSAC